MYLGVDGTGVPMRPLEVQGRPGKQCDGSASTPEAERRAFPDAARRVVLGDGAKWIWGAATEMFPGAIQIVDLFHVSEKLWEVARALFPADRNSAEAHCTELKAGALEAVLATQCAHAGHCEPAAKAVLYIVTNRKRMRYAKFRSEGCRSAPAWSRGPAKRSWGASSSPACTGPRTEPTESSPCSPCAPAS